MTAPAGNSGAGVAPAASAASSLSFEPERPRDYVAPVTAINVEFPATYGTDTEAYLVRGEASQASLSRLANGELTSALAERVVGSVIRAATLGWRIRPEVPLNPGETYSVVSRFGAHGSFRVGAPMEAYLNRIWPPGAGIVHIYCGPTAPSVSTPLKLEGTDRPGTLLPGLNDEGLRAGSCVRLALGEPAVEPIQPPPEYTGVSFDPAVLPMGLSPPPMESADCAGDEITIGPGCGTLLPGAIVVRPPARGQLWALRFGERFHLQIVNDGDRFVIPELGSQSNVELSITVYDEAGRAVTSRVNIEMPAPKARIVINEVMANPVGIEPAQEWIEVSNAGTDAGDLAELSLQDAEMTVALPPLVLPPGGYALLVRDDFDITTPGDVPLPEHVPLVRLPQLSKGGLSNAGEMLRLVDAQGIVSTLPAVPAKVAGVSVARRHPWALDDDLASWASHGAPGASPGTENTFDP